MNALVYSEPYKVPAGLLALAVHAVFFGLLYFGFNWHTEPPQGMVVDLWDSLPDAHKNAAKVVVKQPEPKKVEPPKVVEPPKPVEQPKPEIALKEKKKKEPEKPKPVPKPEPKPVPKVDLQAQQQAEAQRAAEEAQAAARGRVIDEFVGRIRAKIKRKLVMPPDVADDALAEFEVTLLPDGSVLIAKLKKSSGNDAYDSAVERAIIKAQPLPLPPDVTLFNRNFRNLLLKFRPKE